MLQRSSALLSMFFCLILNNLASGTENNSLKRSVSEKLLLHVSSSCITDSLQVSPDRKHAACVFKEGNKQFVVIDGKEGKHYDGIWKAEEPVVLPNHRYPTFSPDGKRLAYAAKINNKWLVVVDGKEGKLYDDIDDSSIIFSPDSKKIGDGVR